MSFLKSILTTSPSKVFGISDKKVTNSVASVFGTPLGAKKEVANFMNSQYFPGVSATEHAALGDPVGGILLGAKNSMNKAIGSAPDIPVTAAPVAPMASDASTAAVLQQAAIASEDTMLNGFESTDLTKNKATYGLTSKILLGR